MLTNNHNSDIGLESWAGEVRVNLIRLVGLLIFYAHHLIQYHLIKDDPWRTVEYHQAVTALAVAWGGMVALIHLVLSRQQGNQMLARYKPWMKYAITVMDLIFIYSLVGLHHEGARGPMVLTLFLVIAAAPLRLSLRLVYVAALGAMLTYMLLIGTGYFMLGSERYYAVENIRRVPRPTQAIMILCLGGAGLFAGQVVRQARRLCRTDQE